MDKIRQDKVRSEGAMVLHSYTEPEPLENYAEPARTQELHKDAGRFIQLLLMPVRSPKPTQQQYVKYLPVPKEAKEYFLDKPMDAGNMNDLIGIYRQKGLKDGLEQVHALIQTHPAKFYSSWPVLIAAHIFNSDTDKALTLWEEFKTMSEAQSKELTVLHYHLLAKIYVRSNKFADAFGVLEKIKAEGIEPDVSFFRVLVSGCAKAKMPLKAWKVYNYMRSECGLMPDREMYHALIQVCAHEKQTERAFNIVEEMKLNQITPNDMTYNHLIAACAGREEFFGTAFETLAAMKRDGFFPSENTYISLMRVCGKAGDVALAEKIYKDAIRTENHAPHLLTELIMTYGENSRVCKSRILAHENVKHIQKLEERYLKLGYEYTLMFANSVLTSLCRSKNPGVGESYFSKLQERGLTPDLVTYTCMLGLYADVRRVVPAQAIWKKIHDVGLVPDMLSYQHYLRALGRSGYLESAVKILREMRAQNWVPSQSVARMLKAKLHDYPDLKKEVEVLTKVVLTKDMYDRKNILQQKLNLRDGKKLNIKLI